MWLPTALKKCSQAQRLKLLQTVRGLFIPPARNANIISYAGAVAAGIGSRLRRGGCVWIITVNRIKCFLNMRCPGWRRWRGGFLFETNIFTECRRVSFRHCGLDPQSPKTWLYLGDPGTSPGWHCLLVMLLGLAFALAAIYRLTKSVWFCVLFHALINTMFEDASFIIRLNDFNNDFIPITITTSVLIII